MSFAPGVGARAGSLTVSMLIPIRDDNPYKRFPLVTALLIAANVWVYLVVGASAAAVEHFGAYPCDLAGTCPAFSAQLRAAFPGRSPLETLFTSMFMHANLLHLGGNMLYLWIFGNNVEDRFGHLRYALFYLVCGVLAAAAHVALSGASTVPFIGASGAISGVLGAYMVLWPRARVLSLVPFLFFLPVEVSAWVLLGLWFLLQVFGALGSIGTPATGGVAVFAHVGGFLAGAAITALFARRPRPHPVDQWFTS
jgi:membrane associated rhomboid family serine protease